MLISHSQTTVFSLFLVIYLSSFGVIFLPVAKVILRLRRSDILFASLTAVRQYRSAFVCSANLRFLDLWFSSTLFYIKITNRKSDWLFLVGAGGPELRSAFVCSANLRFIDLWFESTLFYIKITNRKCDWLFLVGAGGFEPPKSSTTDLQSAPFGHSGTLPHKFILFSQNNGAGGRT